MTLKTRFGFSIILAITLLSLVGCDRRLDKDGGYYDEETQTYRYVRPKASDNPLTDPRKGQVQSVTGVAVKIDDDAKSFWLRIEDRKPYMTLASVLSTQNRSDKTKDIRIYLANVSPPGSIVTSSKLRTQWKEYVSKVLANELINQEIVVEMVYSTAARRFTGTVYTTRTTNGERVTRDLNMWMIQQGLSFYFVDQGPAPNDKAYSDAQKYARQKNLGVWKYQ